MKISAEVLRAILPLARNQIIEVDARISGYLSPNLAPLCNESWGQLPVMG